MPKVSTGINKRLGPQLTAKPATAAGESKWDSMFLRLLVYRAKHGDCRVPVTYPPDQALGNWVKHQRQQLKRVLSDHPRRQKLDRIGFTWKVINTEREWNDMIRRLDVYRRVHGHCRVPPTYLGDPALGVWVSRILKNAPLDNEKRQQLEGMGFL